MADENLVYCSLELVLSTKEESSCSKIRLTHVIFDTINSGS